MSIDIISKFASDDKIKILTRKNLQFALIVCILVDIYSLLYFFDEYIFIAKSDLMRQYSKHFIFTYRVRPFLGFAESVMILICYVYGYIGFKNLSAAINEENSDLFYKACGSFNIALLLKIISGVIIILSSFYHLLFVV